MGVSEVPGFAGQVPLRHSCSGFVAIPTAYAPTYDLQP